MNEEIPVTEARAQLSDLVNRVGFGKERIILTRHGKPLVALVPAEDLPELAEPADEPTPPAAVPFGATLTSAPESRPTYLDVAARASTTPSTRLDGQ